MEGLSLLALTLVALVTSAISAVVGLGGGVTLLAVMAAMMPAPLVVPLHGVVQLVSNGTRAFLLREHVHRRIFFVYVVPATLGVFVGARWYVGSPLPWFRPAVGIFIVLYLLTYLRKPRLGRLPIWIFAPVGLVIGTLASLLGATGPLVAPFFVREDLEKEEVVGTQAAIQIITHLAKIPAFFLMGFAYGTHWQTLVPLVAAAVAGTVLGRRLLGRIPTVAFRRVFMTALFLIAMNLIFGFI